MTNRDVKFVYINPERAFFQCGDEQIDAELSYRDNTWQQPPNNPRTGHLELIYTNKKGDKLTVLSLYDHKGVHNVESWCRESMHVELDSRFRGPNSIDDLFNRVERDKIGALLAHGDYILYATASNSSADLKFGVVMGVRARLDNEGRPKLQVVSEHGVSWRDESRPTAIGKMISLSHFSNIVKIAPTAVPEKLRKAFEAAVAYKRSK